MMDAYLVGAVIVILGCVIVYQAIMFYLDRMRLIKQNADLLDRLMAVDFQSYAAGKSIIEKHKRSALQWKKKDKTEDQDDSPKQEHIGLSVA